MNLSKRQQNTIMLQVKILPATDTNPARILLIQTNNKKRKTLPFKNFNSSYEQIMSELEKMGDVKSYSLAIDNTQREAYIINIDTETPGFPNLIERF